MEEGETCTVHSKGNMMKNIEEPGQKLGVRRGRSGEGEEKNRTSLIES